MKKNIVVYGAIALFFCAALYNVYGFFIERQRVAAEQEVERVEAIEKKLQQAKEAKRKAELEQARRLAEIVQKKVDAEIALANKKIEQQQKIAFYNLQKKAKKMAVENERLQNRIEDARGLGNPEGLPKKMLDGIKQATYLSIRNNPKDYTGNYTPKSLLNIGRLTKGGADGLMLFAMVSDDIKAIEEIIKIGHDVNKRNKSGHSSLSFASAYNSPEIVSFLLSLGANPYLTEGNSLHVASRFNPKPEIIEALVKNGFDVESRDKDGNTPLLVAVKYNQNLQVVDKLIELGADIKAVNNTGKPSYVYALERTQKRVPMGRYKFISEEYQTHVLKKLRF